MLFSGSRNFLADGAVRIGLAVAGLLAAPVAFGACGGTSNSGLGDTRADASAGGATGDGGSSPGGANPGGSNRGGTTPQGSGGAAPIDVPCTGAVDCPGGECVARICRPIVPCTNSRDCGVNVCNTALGRCVTCVTNADCDAGLGCVGSECRPPCTSDRQCTPSGLLCHPTLGACTACVVDRDCSGGDACRDGVCTRPPCANGATTCWNNAVATCSQGTFGNPVPCPPGLACITAGDLASCSAVGAGGATGSGGAPSAGGAGNGGTGGTVGCGTGLDIWLVVDESGSMGEALDAGTRWEAATGGIQAFTTDARPPGAVAVGLVFFPQSLAGAPTVCCVDTDCGAFGPCVAIVPGLGCLIPGTCGAASGCLPATYVPPPVALTPLPSGSSAISAALAAETPVGSSTIAAALEGSRQNAVALAAANPSRRTVLVLITDGNPGGCTTNTVEEVAQIAAAARAGVPPISTYVVSIGDNPALLEPVAAAGGTTLIGIPTTATIPLATTIIADGLRGVVTDSCRP